MHLFFNINFYNTLTTRYNEVPLPDLYSSLGSSRRVNFKDYRNFIDKYETLKVYFMRPTLLRIRF